MLIPKSLTRPMFLIGIAITGLFSLVTLDLTIAIIYKLFSDTPEKMYMISTVGQLAKDAVVPFVLLIVGLVLVKFSQRRKKPDDSTDVSIEPVTKEQISFTRKLMYSILAASFLPFFILHWNGLFGSLYGWFLVLIGKEREFLPQLVSAFISSMIIYSMVVFLFERKLKSLQKV